MGLFDRLLGRRDESANVSSALALGTVTVLLREPCAPGPDGVRRLFEATRALSNTDRLELTPTPLLHFGTKTAQVFVGRAPFPREQVDLRFCAPDFDAGRGFVTIAMDTLGASAAQRAMLGPDVPDAWAAPDGALRRLTILTRALLAQGNGVILHRAGNVVHETRSWMTRVGDPTEPECRPFGAWIDVAFTPERTKLSSWGMSVCGHADLAVEVDETASDAEFALASNALLLACYLTVRRNRALTEGEILDVSASLEVGAYPLAGYPPAPGTPVRRFAVHMIGDGPSLRPL